MKVRTYTAPEDAKPAVGLLSNGSYTVMVTASGGGYSTRNGMAVSRWREDTLCDSWGSFCYLRDVQSGAVWSAGFQPTLHAVRDYEVSFAEDRIEFRRLDDALLGDGDRAGELFGLLNPVNHVATRAGLHKYKVEPYVLAADVYSNPQHTGRGGWTWYTGSAGWLYRAGLEFLLGFELRGESLRFNPCIPRSWREFEISYRRGKTSYHIVIENPGGVSHGVAAVELDGVPQAEFAIKLVDDGREHTVRVVLGSLEGK